MSTHVKTSINGEPIEFLCEPHETLVNVLRETLRLTGTVEGIAGADGLHPVQQKLLENAGLQCGICTPGIVVAAKALLERNPDPSEEEARYWLAGNLCRCTGYNKIITAVLDAAQELRGE